MKTQILRFHPRSHENKKPKEGRCPDARRLYFRKGNGSRRTLRAWILFAFVITSARSRSTAHGGTLPRAGAGSSTAPLRSALRMTQRQSPRAVEAQWRARRLYQKGSTPRGVLPFYLVKDQSSIALASPTKTLTISSATTERSTVISWAKPSAALTTVTPSTASSRAPASVTVNSRSPIM